MIDYANAEQETRALADDPKNQPVVLLNKLKKYFDDVTISSDIPQIPYHLIIIAYDDGEPQVIVYCGYNDTFGWYYDVKIMKCTYRAAAMLQRVDLFISGDDNEVSFRGETNEWRTF